MPTSSETPTADLLKSSETSQNGDASGGLQKTQATENVQYAGAANNSSAGAGTTSTEASASAGDAEKTNNASTNAQTTSTGGTKAGGDEQNTDDTSALETTYTGVSEREENGENTSGSSTGSETTSEEGSESAEDGDNTDAPSTPQDNMQKASETTGSTDKASPENGSCIQVTLPDVLGIGKCLQANLDLCQNENTLIPGVMTLVNCTVTSLFNNLTPKTFFVTVKDILVALIGKLVPGVVRVAEKYLEETKSGENTTIANGTCEGEIKIGIPNSLGKCLDKTLKLCEKGKPIDISIIESLVQALGCILKDLFTTVPHETLKNLLCDLVRLVGDLIGNPVKTAVSAFCSI